MSGLHCGVGQGTGDVDLPTARDPVTGHPYAPGSSLKGVLRDHFRLRQETSLSPAFEAVFGPNSESCSREPDRSVDFASCVSFGDAHLVCLPVRSFRGTFAYLSSPISLKLLQADLRCAGVAVDRLDVPEFSQEKEQNVLLATAASLLAFKGRTDGGKTVLLEDFDLNVEEDHEKAAAWANAITDRFGPRSGLDVNFFKARFAIVSDFVFDFLCETSLPVVARNAMNSDGVAGALWDEEFIPAEAILAGLLHSDDSRRSGHEITAAAALDYVAGSSCGLQLGGKATTGRGLVSFVPGRRSAAAV